MTRPKVRQSFFLTILHLCRIECTPRFSFICIPLSSSRSGPAELDRRRPAVGSFYTERDSPCLLDQAAHPGWQLRHPAGLPHLPAGGHCVQPGWRGEDWFRSCLQIKSFCLVFPIFVIQGKMLRLFQLQSQLLETEGSPCWEKRRVFRYI